MTKRVVHAPDCAVVLSAARTKSDRETPLWKTTRVKCTCGAKQRARKGGSSSDLRHGNGDPLDGCAPLGNGNYYRPKSKSGY